MTWGNLVYQFSETKWNLYASFVTDLVLGFGLIAAVLMNFEVELAQAALWFVLGWFTFTFIEYAVHAWLFHVGSNTFVRGHGKHHRKPQGFDNLPFFGATIVVVGFYFGIIQFIETPYALIYSSALYLGYVAYTLFHFLLHRKDFTSVYGKYMQRFHYVHHMRPMKNFGVTTPIWDFVFRTYEPLKKYTFDADLKARPAENLIKE